MLSYYGINASKFSSIGELNEALPLNINAISSINTDYAAAPIADIMPARYGILEILKGYNNGFCTFIFHESTKKRTWINTSRILNGVESLGGEWMALATESYTDSKIASIIYSVDDIKFTSKIQKSQMTGDSDFCLVKINHIVHFNFRINKMTTTGLKVQYDMFTLPNELKPAYYPNFTCVSESLKKGKVFLNPNNNTMHYLGETLENDRVWVSMVWYLN